MDEDKQIKNESEEPNEMPKSQQDMPDSTAKEALIIEFSKGKIVLETKTETMDQLLNHALWLKENFFNEKKFNGTSYTG